jgi:hypothetical protein
MQLKTRTGGPAFKTNPLFTVYRIDRKQFIASRVSRILQKGVFEVLSELGFLLRKRRREQYSKKWG